MGDWPFRGKGKAIFKGKLSLRRKFSLKFTQFSLAGKILPQKMFREKFLLGGTEVQNPSLKRGARYKASGSGHVMGEKIACVRRVAFWDTAAGRLLGTSTESHNVSISVMLVVLFISFFLSFFLFSSSSSSSSCSLFSLPFMVFIICAASGCSSYGMMCSLLCAHHDSLCCLLCPPCPRFESYLLIRCMWLS